MRIAQELDTFLIQPRDMSYGQDFTYIGNQIVGMFLICDQASSLLRLGWKYVLAYGGSQRRKTWRWLWRNGYILAPCSDYLRCTARILHLACATESPWCHSTMPNDPSPAHHLPSIRLLVFAEGRNIHTEFSLTWCFARTQACVLSLVVPTQF